jgi:hypothetical protein
MSDYLHDAYYHQPGTVIAAASITPPPQDPDYFPQHFEQFSYKVERVVLTQTVTFAVKVPSISPRRIQTEPRTFDRFWRVTVIGGTFRPSSDIVAIWLDDKVVDLGHIVEGGLMAIVHDPSFLHEGTRIGISVGGGATSPVYLIETLHLDSSP